MEKRQVPGHECCRGDRRQHSTTYNVQIQTLAAWYTIVGGTRRPNTKLFYFTCNYGLNRLSNCLSELLSLCNVGDIGRYMGAPNRRFSRTETSPKFGRNRGVVGVFSWKYAISLKRGKIWPRLLLITNRKLHTPFRLVPKSATLDDL